MDSTVEPIPPVSSRGKEASENKTSEKKNVEGKKR